MVSLLFITGTAPTNFTLSTSGDQVILFRGTANSSSCSGSISGVLLAGINMANGPGSWNSGASSTNTSKAPGTSVDFSIAKSDMRLKSSSSVTGTLSQFDHLFWIQVNGKQKTVLTLVLILI
jgi:uncharacterized protein involved in outer membrane biogenesis